MGTFVTARELFDIAQGIERNGAAFYSSVAEAVKDDKAKGIYRRLAADEEQHLATFAGMLSGGDYSLGDALTEEHDSYMKALIDTSVFQDEASARLAARKASGAVEAIDIGIRAEKDSILFYSQVEGLVRRQDREAVTKIIDEERRHLQVLLALKAKL